MNREKLWAKMYDLTGDPWTETDEEVKACKKQFFKDLKTGDLQLYIDCLEEHKDLECRPIDGIHGEYDFERMREFDEVIAALNERR